MDRPKLKLFHPLRCFLLAVVEVERLCVGLFVVGAFMERTIGALYISTSCSEVLELTQICFPRIVPPLFTTM